MMAKTLVERAAAAITLLVLSPVLLGIGLMVRASVGRPVFFRQERTGYRGEPFRLYKFRTMRNEQDASGKPLPDERRLTRTGEWLRRFSLDELPQLINVLRGEVSFVGPRPLMHKYWRQNLYSPEQARRFDVRPGLTGWAQINGRNRVSWEEKFDLDVWYVDNRSAWLDVKILVRTLLYVLRGHGVSEDGHVTSGEFHGSPGHVPASISNGGASRSHPVAVSNVGGR